VTDTLYPPDWDHNSDLHARLAQVLLNSDVSWLQAVTTMGFGVAAMLCGHEDVGVRVTVAEKMAEMIVAAARRGYLEGERVQ